jgi:Amidohydrolase
LSQDPARTVLLLEAGHAYAPDADPAAPLDAAKLADPDHDCGRNPDDAPPIDNRFLAAGRVVFGSDYPYLRRDLAVGCREHIEASPELDDGERAAILGGTATTLIPRLATLRPQTQITRTR